MKMNLSQAAALLGRAAATMPGRLEHALEEAADLVLEEAKSMPGEYQAGAGPFPEWEPLHPLTIRDKTRSGWPVPSPLKRSGELAESYEKTVMPGVAWVGSNNSKALWQELGTHHPSGGFVPPRPVLGIAAARKEKEIVALVGEEVVAHLMSPYASHLTKRHANVPGTTGTAIPIPLKGK